MTKHKYTCVTPGKKNNGLKDECKFEMIFERGTHHCPLCGHLLEEQSDGPSVSEVLRRGQQEVDRQKKGTKK
jgi:hypothetical protein